MKTGWLTGTNLCEKSRERFFKDGHGRVSAGRSRQGWNISLLVKAELPAKPDVEPQKNHSCRENAALSPQKGPKEPRKSGEIAAPPSAYAVP